MKANTLTLVPLWHDQLSFLRPSQSLSTMIIHIKMVIVQILSATRRASYHHPFINRVALLLQIELLICLVPPLTMDYFKISPLSSTMSWHGEMTRSNSTQPNWIVTFRINYICIIYNMICIPIGLVQCFLNRINGHIIILVDFSLIFS